MDSLHKKKWRSGFTLIELLITIAIAAILLTIVVPSFNSIIESSKDRATRDALISAIYTAREEAISKRVNTYLCSTSDGISCNESTDWGNDWIVYQVANTVIALHSSKIDLIKSTEKLITFSPTGHSTITTFKICSNTDQSIVYELSLNRMGRVSYVTGSGDCS